MIYSRSPGWQSPQEQKNVSPAPYPWRKLYSCKNKTFLGPTFPFPWSSGLSSLAALGRQLSCRSRKVKSSPATSFVLTRIHSFRGKERGIYIPWRGRSCILLILDESNPKECRLQAFRYLERPLRGKDIQIWEKKLIQNRELFCLPWKCKNLRHCNNFHVNFSVAVWL